MSPHLAASFDAATGCKYLLVGISAGLIGTASSTL